MKNVNIKKVVAGAAALAIAAGSLGAVVSAANVADSSYTTPNGLARADMFNAQGAPSYNIVVGSTGHASDVVWAANIAAAIGKKAYNVSTASATGGDVVVEVGAEGTSVVSGDGKLYDKEELNEPSEIVLKNTDAEFLGNESIDVDSTTEFGADKYKFSSSKMTVKDQIEILNAKFGFNKDKDIADLVASFPDNSMVYTMTFSGDGIPVGYKDVNSDERVKIKFMGNTYIVDQVDATSMKLLLDKSDLSLSPGDTFEPEDGYILEVVEILQSSVPEGVQYEAELVLKNSSGTVIKTAVYKDGQDVFKNELDAVVKINTVYNSRVTITTGAASSITLTDGREIEDFPKKDDELWDVELTYKKVGADETHLQKIEVKNNVDYEFIDEDSLKVGESLELFGGLANVNFLGLSNETMYELRIENNNIYYVDDADNELNLFMYERRTSDNLTKYTTKGTIDGRKLYFEFDTTAGNFTVKWDDKDGDEAVAATAYNDGTFKDITIDSYENPDLSYTYGVYVDEDASSVVEFGIGLKKGTIISDMAGIGTILSFDEYDQTPINEDYTDVPSIVYFGATSSNPGIDDNDGLVDAQYQAYGQFTIANTVGSAINLYVDAWTGKLIDTESSNFKDLSYQVKSDAGDLSVRNSDDLRWAMTNKGAKYSISSGRFSIDVPEKALTARVFVGAGATSSTTMLGSEVTLTTPGEVVDADGIKVKLVSAPQGSATTYTPAAFGNIAYLDTDTLPAGNKIIVGGWMVNEEAKNLGLQDLVTKAGDFVAGKNAQGNIVVAGFHKEDTANAAKELIAAIEAMN